MQFLVIDDQMARLALKSNCGEVFDDELPFFLCSISVSTTGTITKVRAKVNSITHTYDSDLLLRLFHPDGSFVDLSKYHGSSENNYVNTLFDDSASTSIALRDSTQRAFPCAQRMAAKCADRAGQTDT